MRGRPLFKSKQYAPLLSIYLNKFSPNCLLDFVNFCGWCLLILRKFIDLIKTVAKL